MSILVEIESFGQPEAGRSRLAAAMQQARTNNTPSHPVFDWAGKMAVAGPALAFDRHAIGERMRWLADAATAHMISPLLAVKSCTLQPYLELAHQYLGGYDISNFNEYAILPEDLRGKLVSLTAPVLPTDLNAFRTKGNGLVVTLDSQVQLEQFFSRPQACDYVLRVKGTDLLRGMEPADPAYYPVTRFGFSLSEVHELMLDSRLQSNPPAGFHVHHGSEVNRVSTFRRMAGRLADLARALNISVKNLNVGGGWHQLTSAEVAEVMAYIRGQFPWPINILLEPGRWYGKSAGYAIGTVANLSRDRDIIRCTLNLSSRCHLHWSNPTLLHFTEPHHEQGCVVQFFGASCYESDLIGKYIVPYSGDMLADTGFVPGSRVIFGNVSTYSTAWNTSFNGVSEADVMWMKTQA